MARVLSLDDDVCLVASAGSTATNAYLIDARSITVVIPDSIDMSSAAVNLDVNNSKIIKENTAIVNPIYRALLSNVPAVSAESQNLDASFDNNWTSVTAFNENILRIDGPFRFIRFRKASALPTGFKAYIFADINVH